MKTMKTVKTMKTMKTTQEKRTTTTGDAAARATPSPTRAGLEGVYVADSALTRVDGEAGSLLLRGVPIDDLAGERSFAAIIHLLWSGEAAGQAEEAAIDERLGLARARAFELLPRLGDALRRDNGMDALRAALAHVSADEGGGDPLLGVGAMATFAAAWLRISTGAAPIAPSPSTPHAADFLRMAVGEADPAAARAVDAYLATIIDHGMNASTFAARVVASTGSDLISALVAGLGALKGPLHGGAPGPVLDMLDAIGDPSRAEAWLREELAQGRRIMGMGHRVYRVRDPRAAVLERQALLLAEEPSRRRRIELARAVEACAEGLLRERYPARRLRANVEFYTALVLEAVGLPRSAFTPTFAVGRVAGWCAHVAEQRREGRLIRPRARYVGPLPATRVA